MHFPKVKLFFNKQVTLEDFSCHSLIVPVETKTTTKKAVAGKRGMFLREIYIYTHTLRFVDHMI